MRNFQVSHHLINCNFQGISSSNICELQCIYHELYKVPSQPPRSFALHSDKAESFDDICTRVFTTNQKICLQLICELFSSDLTGLISTAVFVSFLWWL